MEGQGHCGHIKSESLKYPLRRSRFYIATRYVQHRLLYYEDATVSNAFEKDRSSTWNHVCSGVVLNTNDLEPKV